jgi:hypothetical protein
MVIPPSCFAIDPHRRASEELIKRSRIRRVEGRRAQRLELTRGVLERFGIPAGEDQPSPLGACSPGGFEPMPAQAANPSKIPPAIFEGFVGQHSPLALGIPQLPDLRPSADASWASSIPAGRESTARAMFNRPFLPSSYSSGPFASETPSL